MKNVHPRVLEAVLARLPKGAEIVGAMAESATQTLFMVKTANGALKRTVMNKADVSTYLGNQVVDIAVEEGTSMDEAMELLSRKYRLFLVPQVDYNVGSSRIVFGDQLTLERSVPILETSVSLAGTLNFTLRHKAKCTKSSGSVAVLLESQKTQVALASNVFQVSEGQYLKEDQLTQAFSQTVVDYLKACQLEVIPTVEELTAGKVLGVLNDGISDFLAFRSAQDQTWYVRFALADAKEEEPA